MSMSFMEMELKNWMLSLISYIILVVCVLISVAFLTLMERKVLGYIQIRKGPNSVGFLGLLQPFADAIKLFLKEQVNPTMSNYFMYYLCPMMSLFLSLLVWMVFPLLNGMISFDLGLLFFICVTSLGVYSVMLAGWSSNSNYALLGGLRSVAQTISYEVSLVMIVLSLVMLVGGFNLELFEMYQVNIWFVVINFPLFICWVSSCLAETNRTPFDFAEGESELVSGFNVEYSGGGFALIFMAEYSSILFMSMLISLLFFGGDINSFLFYMKFVIFSFIFIWVRGTLPRFRYDKLMYLTWKSYLPVSMNYLLFSLGFYMFI